MRNTVLLLLITLSFALTAAADSANAPALSLNITRNEKPKFHNDRVLVQMKSASSFLKTNYSFQKTADAYGLTFDRTVAVEKSAFNDSETAYALMKLDVANDSVEQAVARLKNNPDVEFAQPDYIYELSAVPNDPMYGSQWGLKNTGQTLALLHPSQTLYTGNPGTAGADMGTETAWDTLTDCSSVVVAVMDTGMNLAHEDLAANLWVNGALENGYDFANLDNNPTDFNGHGTHVAGTIGARGNNAVGTTGVCWRVQLMVLKVFPDAGGGASSSALIAAVNYARVNNANIINMSLGGPSFDQLFFNAIKTASDAGVLSVVAAGNDGTNNGSAPKYPCNYEIANVVCVGATNQSNGRAAFSNYSTTFVDVGAPGTNILSPWYAVWDTPINIPLTNGTWTRNNANFALTGTSLQNPALWDGVVNYANNQTDTAYTSVNTSGIVAGNVYMGVRGESEANTDYLGFYESAAGGNPITAGVRQFRLSSTTGGALVTVVSDLTLCINTPACTVGFQFTSSAATTKIGFKIESLGIDPLVAGTAGYESIQGTSMASPHVAGVAALVKASNPAFTAADIKNALVTKGTTVSSLATAFKSSSVVNAASALKYVDPPAGVGAVVVP